MEPVADRDAGELSRADRRRRPHDARAARRDVARHLVPHRHQDDPADRDPPAHRQASWNRSGTRRRCRPSRCGSRSAVPTSHSRASRNARSRRRGIISGMARTGSTKRAARRSSCCARCVASSTRRRRGSKSGLTVLASIGSTAPFVGLFGTVWGVYHALTAIGLSGQGTLDKVAGPVGEALIMTAAGSRVAIPAVLAYNALVRGNRVDAGRARRVRPRPLRVPHDRFARARSGADSWRCRLRRSPGRREMAFGNFERKGGAAPMAEINMIPLIDVMLVLLVIFIITAPLLTHAVKIDLPKANSAPEPDQAGSHRRVDRRASARCSGTARSCHPPSSHRACRRPPRGNRSRSCTCAPIARRSTRRSPTSWPRPRARACSGSASCPIRTAVVDRDRRPECTAPQLRERRLFARSCGALASAAHIRRATQPIAR